MCRKPFAQGLSLMLHKSNCGVVATLEVGEVKHWEGHERAFRDANDVLFCDLGSCPLATAIFQICWHIECSTFTASYFRV